jgi:PAS domain S-box-containing protein
MPDSARLHVLVVDDDRDTRANLCDILELDDYCVATAGSVAEALNRDNWADFAAIILDRRLPDGSAEELLPQLQRLAPHAAIMIVTGYSDLQGVIAALQQGAADYILKPINPDSLRASLARVGERQRLAKAKERSEAAFRTLVEAAPCMIVILRPDRRILYFSRFAEELTGYCAGDVLDKDYGQQFLPSEYQQGFLDEIQRVLAGTPARGLEKPLVCRDGSRRWMVWNAQLMDDAEGQPAILAVGQDITKLKQAQEQAVQSERLAAIGQMMTGLAHESGNALARSQSCLEMLAWEVEDRPEALNLIDRIQKAQDHLRQLYEEVRGYAAPLRLDCEVWDLRSIWRQAWENLALARKGRETLLREEADGVDLRCPVDQFRLEQVFRNLLDNSLAACRDPVQIVVRCTECQLGSRPAVRVAVRDNGPGLSGEQERKIFDPFFTTKTKGTGLGMAIAKRIVEAHGGQIAVGAGFGNGAEIVLTLLREKP